MIHTQSALMACTAALMFASAAVWAVNGQWTSTLVFAGFGVGYLGLAIQFSM